MYKYICDAFWITRINPLVNQFFHLGKFNYFLKKQYFFVVHVDYSSLQTETMFSYIFVWHLAYLGQDSTINKNNNCSTLKEVLHNVKQHQL